MTGRLERKHLRRADRRSGRRLPGRALGRANLPRQALIGFGAGLACAGGLACTWMAVDRAEAWRDAASGVLILLPGASPADPSRPDPAGAALARSVAGAGAREIAADPLTGLPDADAAGTFILVSHPAPDLQARLRQSVPGSVVEPDGGAPARRLAAFGTRLAAASAVLSGLAAAASLGALAFAAAGAVRRAGASARLLADLGMTPGAIDRRLAVPLALAALAGCTLAVAAVGGAWRSAWPGPLPVWPAGALAAAPPVAAFATALAGIDARRRLLRDAGS